MDDLTGGLKNLLKRRNTSDDAESEPKRKQVDRRPVVQFTAYIDETKQKYRGRNGLGEVVHFVPYAALEKYWKNSAITEVCNSYKPYLSNRFDAIRKNSLRIFSILVYLDKAEYHDAFLQYGFGDKHLPFEEAPPKLSAPVYKELFDGISEHQWTFCPLTVDRSILVGIKLGPRHILPFFDVRTISDGRSSTSLVEKVCIFEDCIEMDKKDRRPKPKVLVVKRYFKDTHRQMHANETKALETLHSSKNEHIVAYYGSFIQKGTFKDDGTQEHPDSYNLLLQYADGGNLRDFLRTRPPPESAEHARQFWRSLFKTFEGLHHVHQVQIREKDSDDYRGIHQDIKPDNILLEKMAPPASHFEFSPLLADFGHSYIGVAPENTDNEDDDFGVDKHGNQIYSAPECTHYAKYMRDAPNNITWQADIFAMGCVVSEAAVWLAFGPSGIQEYWYLRVGATDLIEGLKSSGRSGCFHNGTGRLACVAEMHNRVREACHADDLLTPGVLELIESHMLLPQSSKRYSAREVNEKFKQLQGWARVSSAVSSTASAVTSTVSTVTGFAGRASKFIPIPMMRQTSASSSSKKDKTRPIVTTTAIPVSELRSPVSDDMTGTTVGSSPGSPATTTGDSDIPPGGRSPKLPTRPGPSPIQPTDTCASRRHSEPTPLAQDGFSPSEQQQNHSLTVPTLYTIPANSTSQTSLHSDAGSIHSVRSNISNISNLSTLSSYDPTSRPPPFTIAQAGEWRRKYKKNEVFEKADSEVHNTVRTLQANLRGRHHLFYIDNGMSMAAHKDAVEEAFQNLAYVVKYRPGWDERQGKKKGGGETGLIELEFASTVGEDDPLRSSSVDGSGRAVATTKLVEALRGVRYELIGGIRQERFGRLVDEVLLPKLELGAVGAGPSASSSAMASPALLQVEGGEFDGLSFHGGGQQQYQHQQHQLLLLPQQRTRGSTLPSSFFSVGGSGSGGGGGESSSQLSEEKKKKKADEHQKAKKKNRPSEWTVIVFTDGLWGNMRDHVRRLVEGMRERGVGRTRVTVQLLRFGHSEDGERNLRELVEFARSPTTALNWDILDTRPVTGDVCEMLIGRINEDRDSIEV